MGYAGETKGVFMGIARTDIVLKNYTDVVRAQEGIIREKDVRQVQVLAVADTGCGTMVITPEVCKKLGLRIIGKRPATQADGISSEQDIAEGVEIHWQNRNCICRPIVIDTARECLLGAIPMEDLDLRVNPGKFCVEPAHEGDEPTVALYHLMLDGPVVEYPASRP
jgi:clan AA aspartic protease